MIHLIGSHEHAEEEIPIILRKVMGEGLVPGVKRCVCVLSELGFIFVVAEFCVDVDLVVELFECAVKRVVAGG